MHFHFSVMLHAHHMLFSVLFIIRKTLVTVITEIFFAHLAVFYFVSLTNVSYGLPWCCSGKWFMYQIWWELLIWSDFEVNNGQLIMFYYYESIFIVFGLCNKLFELYDIWDDNLKSKLKTIFFLALMATHRCYCSAQDRNYFIWYKMKTVSNELINTSSNTLAFILQKIMPA